MKKFLVSISLTVNAIVFTAIVFMYFSGGGILVNYYIQPAQERWISQFEILDVQPGDVVFLGDSITEGGSWHELFPAIPVRNRGIGGDTADGVLARIGQISRGKPSKVFLMIGTNDLTMDVEVPTIIGNINNIVDTIHKKSPATEVFVQSVLPRQKRYRARVEELNAGLRESIRGKAQWLDIYPLMLNTQEGSIRAELSNDELHLNGGGYRIWRDAIATHVDANS